MASSSPRIAVLPEPVRRGLDAVIRRIRLLHLVSGLGRLLLVAVLTLAGLYAADRLLDLPLVVRGAAGLIALGLVLREAWRRVGRPQVAGPDRLEAARLVESHMPGLEGRVISAMQLPDRGQGSLEARVVSEAAGACERLDLLTVLTSGPSLKEAARGLAAVGLLLAGIVLGQPYLDVFVQRWTFSDVAWPRDTHLMLELQDRSPVHVVLEDGRIAVSRSGVVALAGRVDGRRPDRVEIVVDGADGERSYATVIGLDGRYQGHLTVEAGDRSVRLRGGDDEGDDNRRELQVVEPPRLAEPRFHLEPPAYLEEEPREVGPEGLRVAEGTTITVEGRPTGETTSATLWLTGEGEQVPLEVLADGTVRGSFVAESSDSLAVVLTGAHELVTPDPVHHALLVQDDRSPALRIYAPARSDVKVTSRALLPFAVLAEDDHGVDQVVLQGGDDLVLPFEGDVDRPGHHRLVLDLAELELEGAFAYAIEASDRRDLPGRGPQVVRMDGRRVDVVEEPEVQRLLADRQLRLKEAFAAVAERQERAILAVDDLLLEIPPADDPDLVAVAVTQNQVTTRLGREARELCSVLDETLLNRLDRGPGAESLLERRLEDWRRLPVDQVFVADTWRGLSDAYAEGRFGRLDLAGRLLEMTGLALTLSEDLAPRAYDALLAARSAPDEASLGEALRSQGEVREALLRLLDRMDEWEDYQEVLTLVKTLIEDQKTLRERTQHALSNGGRN